MTDEIKNDDAAMPAEEVEETGTPATEETEESNDGTATPEEGL